MHDDETVMKMMMLW